MSSKVLFKCIYTKWVATLELASIDERRRVEIPEFTKDISSHCTDPAAEAGEYLTNDCPNSESGNQSFVLLFFSFWIHTFPFLCVFQRNFSDSFLHYFCDKEQFEKRALFFRKKNGERGKKIM